MIWLLSSAMAGLFSLPDLTLQPNSAMEVRVYAPRAFHPVYLMGSVTGLGQGPCIGHRCLDLQRPFVVDAVPDSPGPTVFEFQVPPGTMGVVVWLQMVQIDQNTNTIMISPPRAYMIGDTDGDFVADDVDICPFDPDPAQTDADGDGFGLACDCDDYRADINPDIAIDIPNNGIDEDCNGRESPDPMYVGRYVGSLDIIGAGAEGFDFRIESDGRLTGGFVLGANAYLLEGGGIVGNTVNTWFVHAVSRERVSRISGTVYVDTVGTVADLGQAQDVFGIAGLRFDP